MNNSIWIPIFVSIIITIHQILRVSSHGYLADPPARTSAWRFGFKTPKNYDDNAMWCGGLSAKIAAGGRCGVCGDPYRGPKNAEVGGKWVTNPPKIVRTYRRGRWIEVKVTLTAAHKGYFQFRVCPATSTRKEVTMACLRKHTLEIEGFLDKKYKVGSNKPIRVKLPQNLKCHICVFQWDYTCGNNWGAPPMRQETFKGCADIQIK